MEQIIPDNENIEDYFDEDEIDIWNSIEDSLELETLYDLRDALNRWVDDIYETGVPNDTKIQHTNLDGKLFLKVHNIFMTKPEEEGKSDLFMTIEQLKGNG